MRFKNYINRHNKKNRIYAEEELLSMTLEDYGEELETTEENPVVLDGGVSKTVIPQIEDLKDKIQIK